MSILFIAELRSNDGEVVATFPFAEEPTPVVYFGIDLFRFDRDRKYVHAGHEWIQYGVARIKYVEESS